MNEMCLKEWLASQGSEDGLEAKPEQKAQVEFIQRVLIPMLTLSDNIEAEEQKEETHICRVVGIHAAHGIVLPVYKMYIRGAEITLKGNLENWFISVNSRKELFNLSSASLFDPRVMAAESPDNKYGPYYGPYLSNNRQFTLQLDNKLQLYSFFWILAESLGMRNAFTERPKQQTDKELAAIN